MFDGIFTVNEIIGKVFCVIIQAGVVFLKQLGAFYLTIYLTAFVKTTHIPY